MSPKTAAGMRWHEDSCVKDCVLRHPDDITSSKALYDIRTSLEEPANVRVGLIT